MVDQVVGIVAVLNVTLPGVVIVQFVGNVPLHSWVAYVACVTLTQLVLKPREVNVWFQVQFEGQENMGGESRL